MAEAALRRIEGVTDAAVLAQDDAARGTRLVAFVAGLPADGAGLVRAALARELDPVLVPRRIVLGEIPRESTGKIRRERLVQLLATPDEAATEVVLHADSPYFGGHFQGEPVFPGAAMVAVLAATARDTWPDLGTVKRLQRIRFQKPLGPDVRVDVRMRRSDASVSFEAHLLHDAEAAVTGKIEFTPVAETQS